MLKTIFLSATMVLMAPLVALDLMAQPNPFPKFGFIQGKVLDAQQHGVMYASVSLLRTDSTFVKGAISDLDGYFMLEKVDDGTYRLKVEHVEFQTNWSEPFAVTAGSGTISKDIQLSTAVNELGEVVVTYRRPLIEVTPDKLVFNVSSSPSAAGTNALELLRRAPGVTLDMENNIALLGKSGVQIYINGVRSRLSGTDLVTFLQSMTSDNVEAIEIIANPSAKYDAEGTAGIINIQMKKNIFQGFNGNLVSSFTQGRYARYSNALTLNYGGEKFRTNAEITQSEEKSFDNFLDSKKQNSALLDLYSNEVRWRRGLNVGVGLEATLSENHLVSLNGRSVFNQNEHALFSQTDIFVPDQTGSHQILLSQSLVDLPSQNHTFNLDHQWKIQSAARLQTTASFGKFANQKSTFQPNTLLESDGVTVIAVEDAAFDADTDIQLWSAQTDFEKEWEKLSLSTGFKYSGIRTDNRFDFFNFQNQQPVFDPSQSNDFSYQEYVSALYALLNLKVSTRIKLHAGMRMENTQSRGLLVSQTAVDNKDVRRNYTDFFPNLSLSYDNQGDHALSFNIGRRITRPNYQDLNPFETPISQLTIWKGNPFLAPKYTMNYQLSYAFRQKLIFSGTYSITKNFFASIFEIIGENSNQIIPRNMQKATDLGILVSFPVDVAKFWRFNTFLNGSYRTYNGNLEGTLIDLDVTNYSLRMQHNFKLPWEMTLDLQFFMENNWIWRGSIRVRGNQDLGFGLRKSFFEKKLQITITGADILRTTNDYFYRGNYGGIDIDGVRSFDSQRFGMGVNWKFGNQKIKAKGKTKGALDDALNRIDD